MHRQERRNRAAELIYGGIPEVDVVLTTREFARLLRREGVDFKSLEPSEFDNPYMSEFSGAGAIFGTTGGVMEAALRTLYYVVNGRELEQIELTQLRGFEGVRLATVELSGEIGTVKVAMAHGLKPTRQIVEAVLAGAADFDFIEIMACPGGSSTAAARCARKSTTSIMKRRETLFGIDRKAKARQSHKNPQVQALYRDFLGHPNSEKAHKLLHTRYTDRRLETTRTVSEIWREITMRRRSTDQPVRTSRLPWRAPPCPVLRASLIVRAPAARRRGTRDRKPARRAAVRRTGRHRDRLPPCLSRRSPCRPLQRRRPG